MLKSSLTSILFLSVVLSPFQVRAQSPGDYLKAASCPVTGAFALHIHGGVTYRDRPERQARRKKFISGLLEESKVALEQGVSSLDVISFALTSMENSGIFNAGSGSIPNQAGYREMDASIMTGHDRDAGAVASVQQLKNPILAARYVMEETKNVFFVGNSADDFLSGKLTKADPGDGARSPYPQ